ncbi:fluoride efflux transporter FluC [Nesterenkonia sp. HG001]|uniref:fluoride efflux transporter FluC n=1 Tax=Nesterenkonia sp. HG001 TaxID=2983207 RepID=UPI002AC79738|nr:CrcB family protein [Nesterenkonia sp. HG001]MDZ5079026.1 CrcB family protein [Nesterenkonia sp. HG001]
MTDELSVNEPLDTDADTGPGLRGIGLVALGGTVGTLARYLLDALIGDTAGLPLGIFIINITGAFLLGVLIESLPLGGPDRGRRRDLRLLLGTGLLGGYTTYSLLASDIAALLIGHHIAEALGYGLATVLLGSLASWTGILTARTRRARS